MGCPVDEHGHLHANLWNWHVAWAEPAASFDLERSPKPCHHCGMRWNRLPVSLTFVVLAVMLLAFECIPLFGLLLLFFSVMTTIGPDVLIEAAALGLLIEIPTRRISRWWIVPSLAVIVPVGWISIQEQIHYQTPPTGAEAGDRPALKVRPDDVIRFDGIDPTPVVARYETLAGIYAGRPAIDPIGSETLPTRRLSLLPPDFCQNRRDRELPAGVTAYQPALSGVGRTWRDRPCIASETTYDAPKPTIVVTMTTRRGPNYGLAVYKAVRGAEKARFTDSSSRRPPFPHRYPFACIYALEAHGGVTCGFLPSGRSNGYGSLEKPDIAIKHVLDMAPRHDWSQGIDHALEDHILSSGSGRKDQALRTPTDADLAAAYRSLQVAISKEHIGHRGDSIFEPGELLDVRIIQVMRPQQPGQLLGAWFPIRTDGDCAAHGGRMVGNLLETTCVPSSLYTMTQDDIDAKLRSKGMYVRPR